MFKQLLTNKKIVIVALAVVLALIIGIMILVITDKKETGGKDSDIKTEQSEEDANSKNDNEQEQSNDRGDDSAGLEILEPDEIATEDSSEASGSWGNESNSNAQTGDSNTYDKTEDEKHDKPEKNQDILQDDIDWGNIY